MPFRANRTALPTGRLTVRLLHRLATCTLTALVTLLSPETGKSEETAEDRRVPNIVLILADDLGYSDIGPYGGEIDTPNINILADKGVRFTQFYNTARCCPTRACLLTGLYPHQAGVGHMMDDRKLPGYQGDLNRNCMTIAEVLRESGYATYISGKWHVTKHTDPDGPKFNWPLQRGFDHFFGTIHGAGSFFDPNSLTRDNTQIPPGENFYYTDAISDNAATFIHENAKEKPFFMYVAYTCPHWPMHAKPGDIEKYKGYYDAGWDQLRVERYQRMVQMGLIDEQWPLTPRDRKSPAWEDAELKEWHRRRMEVYAAMVDCMDQGIGRIVNALKKSGQYENTLLLFLADNGGCAEENGSRGEPREVAPKLEPRALGPDELQTRMVPQFTRDGKPVRQGRGVMPGPPGTYVAYGLPWANASNTPFREYKHWVHEGGISTPLIAHWPAGISAERHGKFERQPGHLIDLMATCVDVAEAKYPENYKGEAITPMQGVSLRPGFAGEDLGRKQPIFWEHEGNRAVRVGEWKLVAKGPRGKWELYDMAADRSEVNDLSAEHPDRTEAMARTWEEWAVAAKAKPWPWDKKE